jgi:sortase A
MKARVLWILAAAFLALGTWHLASASWIHAKAQVAQVLIARAWERAMSGPATRPWPGADMRPIARLQVPSRAIDLYVMDNASPRTLAFGPGHVAGTARPGVSGNSVIVAHRDTHFAFLRDLRLGDEIVVDTRAAYRVRYRVSEITVVDKGEARVLDPADAPQLTLVTCYPFDAIRPGTPWRYVVIAERVA